MSRVLVTGAGGLVGTALCNYLKSAGQNVVPVVSRKDCDLTSSDNVFALFRSVRPTALYHLAANVFGVGGNLSFPGEVYYRNTIMNTVIVEAAREVGVQKIVAMGSAAMYSDGLKQPMAEADAMVGEPHGSEYAYAFSKRAMLAQLKAYQQQYGLAYGFVVATNMYGPHDKFDPLHGHVVPSLLKKFIDAEANGGDVEIWGDGSPTRDFLYSADAANGLARIMDQGDGVYNLATGLAVPIKALVLAIAEHFPTVSYHWNIDKPLGQIKRSYDVERIRGLGFTPAYDLKRGIAETVEWLRANVGQVRQ